MRKFINKFKTKKEAKRLYKIWCELEEKTRTK